MQILPFSNENLAKSLAHKFTPEEVISKKYHFLYLKEYLNSADLGAKTIVIEENYISKDFIHDFASYYALCFEEYSKFCKRVHFFNKSFDDSEFKKVILDKEKN